MSRMRLRIAERLKAAQNTCAMLTTFNEVDMRCYEAYFLMYLQLKILSKLIVRFYWLLRIAVIFNLQ